MVTENTGKVLNFFDTPADACLRSFDLFPSIPWLINSDVRNICDGKTVSGVIEFTTMLVGVSASNEVVPLDCFFGACGFTWKDNYNGWFDTSGTGGILAAPGANLPIDPESGVGGITIISINGIPVAPVPEPSSVSFFAVCLAVTWLFVRQRKNPSNVDPIPYDIYNIVYVFICKNAARCRSRYFSSCRRLLV